MLKFLLDEHLRGPIWFAILRHNSKGGLPIDALRVGDAPDLPLGSDDATILLWAEREDRIVLTVDLRTMPGHLMRHLQSGRHSPGFIKVDLGRPIHEIVSHLELVGHAGDAKDYADTITFAP